MSTNDKIKFRPSLNASNINHIMHLAKTEQPLSQNSINLLAVLAPFAAKIENYGVKPAYTVQPSKPSTLHLLGGEPAPESLSYQIVRNGIVHKCTKEEYWADCYHKSIHEPASSMTAIELLAAKEHMYLNDLMTVEEKIAFESESLGGAQI